MKSRSFAFTLVELLVAMTITLLIVLTIFYFYINLSAGQRRAQEEIHVLVAIRNTIDRLERDLRQAVVKSGYVPGSPPRFKALNNGMFRIQWPDGNSHLQGYADGLYQEGRCRYLGFYTTSDSVHVDRVEYYFNPPEPRGKQTNKQDDDFDDDPSDASNPVHLMRDDRGRVMLRRVRDENLTYDQYHNLPPDGVDDRAEPGVPAYRAPHLTGLAASEFDSGDIHLLAIISSRSRKLSNSTSDCARIM